MLDAKKWFHEPTAKQVSCPLKQGCEANNWAKSWLFIMRRVRLMALVNMALDACPRGLVLADRLSRGPFQSFRKRRSVNEPNVESDMFQRRAVARFAGRSHLTRWTAFADQRNVDTGGG